MKPVLLLFALASPLLAQTVTGVTFDGVSHSALRMTISYTGEFNAIRARYIPAPASCRDGVTGQIQAVGFFEKFNPMPVIVSGLKGGTTYEICAELSNDGGSTWSRGFGSTVMTQPLPAQHPALPLPPEKFDSNYPDTSTFTQVATNNDCSDLHDLLMAAIYRSLNSGTVINLPTGGACLVNPFDFNVNPPDLLWFGQAAITISGSTLTLPNHGLAEGQKIQIANYSPYLGGSLPSTEPIALANGQTYYAHILDANRIQVYFRSPANHGGTLLKFTSQGSGNNQNYVVPLPRRTKPIVIQATGAHTALPEHVRVTPGNANVMTQLIMPRSQIGRDPRHYLFRFSDLDSNVRRAIGNIRFVGIEFTTEDFPDLHNTIDPPDFENIFLMSPWNSQINLDRCLVHSAGTPTRWNRGMFWDGAYLAVIDSYFENLTYFRAMNENVVASILDGKHAHLTAGTSYSGGSTHALSVPVTITISGTGSGDILTGWNLQTNRFTVWTPANLAAACDGIACVNATYTSPSNGSCNWSDAWPRNASGWVSAHPTGCFGATNGFLNAVVEGDPTSTQWTTEGCNFMIGGFGPGPYKVVNTMIEGAGLAWHHDDGGQDNYLRGDYDYEKNTFHADFRYRYGSKQSDHLRYFHRQMVEWKSGHRLYFSGNIFDGGWVEGNPASVMVALTAVHGQTITDINFENNEFRHGPGGLNVMVPTKGHDPVVLPPQRFRMFNNLIWDINSTADTTCNGQPSYFVASGWPCSTGWFLQGPWSSEDVIIDRNTFLGNSGRVPSFMRLGDGPVEGVSITNNVITFADQGLTLEPIATGEPCWGLNGKELADCKLPGYTMTGNIFVGQSGGFSETANTFAGALSNLGSNFLSPAVKNGAGADIADLRAAQSNLGGSSSSECTACLPSGKNVLVGFRGSVNGGKIVVTGFGCNPGTYGLPVTLTMSITSSCNAKIAPPDGYDFGQWNDLSTLNPRVFAVPSSDSAFTFSFNPWSAPPSTPNSGPPASDSSTPDECTACLPGDKKVAVDFRGSVSGGTIIVAGFGCSSGTYALPVTLNMSVASLCSAQIAPPDRYDFGGWNDLSTLNPRVVAVPSSDSAFTFSFNPLGAPPTASIPSPPQSGVRYVPITPCRVMDTRERWVVGGGPVFKTGETRLLQMMATRCNVPAARAYALNVTVVPSQPLRWITVWPAGMTMPFTSLLNSYDGRIKSSATIVAAGDNNDINIFTTDETQVIIDLSGYFVAESQSAFHPLQTCRVVDTRIANGLLGSPAIPALTERSFPILRSQCGLPETAEAYSMNLTVIPRGRSLTWMTAWPSGQDRPFASALNAPTNAPVANSAIVQRGNGGNVSVYGSDDFDLVVDVNGYFASQSGGYAFYPRSPCRMLDSRQSDSRHALNGSLTIDTAGTCAISAQARVVAIVVTAVPQGPLDYLTLWKGGDRPWASTLNAYDAAVTSNFVIEPLTDASTFDIFSTNPTHVVIDSMGYFAP